MDARAAIPHLLATHAPPVTNEPHPYEPRATHATHPLARYPHAPQPNASVPYAVSAPDFKAPIVIEPAQVRRDAPTLPTGPIACLPEKPPGRIVAALRRLLGR
jgi:hypothetical protein